MIVDGIRVDMEKVLSFLKLLSKNVGKSFEEENKMVDIRVGDVVRITDKDDPVTVVTGRVDSVNGTGTWFSIERVSGSFYAEFWHIEILEREVELPTGEGALALHAVHPDENSVYIRRGGTWYEMFGFTVKVCGDRFMANKIENEDYEVVFEGV